MARLPVVGGGPELPRVPGDRLTEFPKEDGKPSHLRCPHPAKFILAVWLSILQGQAYTQAEIDARFRVEVVEIMGRSSFWSPERVFDGQPVSAAADPILEDAWERCMVGRARTCRCPRARRASASSSWTAGIFNSTAPSSGERGGAGREKEV